LDKEKELSRGRQKPLQFEAMVNQVRSGLAFDLWFSKMGMFASFTHRF
jgi:hypothetical protein